MSNSVDEIQCNIADGEHDFDILDNLQHANAVGNKFTLTRGRPTPPRQNSPCPSMPNSIDRFRCQRERRQQLRDRLSQQREEKGVGKCSPEPVDCESGDELEDDLRISKFVAALGISPDKDDQDKNDVGEFMDYDEILKSGLFLARKRKASIEERRSSFQSRASLLQSRCSSLLSQTHKLMEEQSQISGFTSDFPFEFIDVATCSIVGNGAENSRQPLVPLTVDQ